MFVPCFAISSMRVGLDFEISYSASMRAGLDFEISYSSSKSKRVFRYHP
jgi:hypothetical protein